MASGDRYKLVDTQNWSGNVANPFLNVFYFLQTAGTGGALELVTEWITDVLPDIVAVQADNIAHTNIDCFNLDSPTDFSLNALSPVEPGTRTGDALPLFCAWAFRYNRASLLSRNGSKRFGGVVEGDQNEGQPVGAIITLLNALAVRLGTAIIDGSGNSWEPRIGRVAPPAAFTSFPVANVSFVNVTTQNTRKR